MHTPYPPPPGHTHQQPQHHQQQQQHSHQHHHQHVHQQQHHQAQVHLPIPPDMHTPSHPVPQQYLPSMAPPPPSYSEIGSLPPASDVASQAGSATQERPPLTADQLAQQRENLIPWSKQDDQGRVYSLHVVQQPQRARMCGFGDKDRRPITPPPCVRLSVKDVRTGREIDLNEIEHTLYVLNVDLWSDDALKEVNLVRHTTASPSISSTSPASYAAIESSTPAYTIPSNMTRDSGYSPQLAYASSQTISPYSMQPPFPSGFVSQNGYGQPYYPHRDYQDVSLQHTPMFGPPRVFEPQFSMARGMSIGGSAPAGMFTRNLIGSLAASAFRLSDTEDKIGIWFILQDLSVRTEGTFRLRFSFVNVAPPMSSPNQNGEGQVNQGKAPVLAAVFSDVFQVYSAKKFPGVCESTALSKCFAQQGIKIPIRKEGAEKKGGGDDDEGDY
ncbi:velvet factor-domain-containing protein [Podospora fimiseda]|uniref:Velvet factor-domain-containing protein n=1 Tax=Podospora fimiseda TaxID=252190 RepID=A0AAN7H704_9PEZI|nr:velvet factor-domain-containing protein [Podospora fimiseda]